MKFSSRIDFDSHESELYIDSKMIQFTVNLFEMQRTSFAVGLIVNPINCIDHALT